MEGTATHRDRGCTDDEFADLEATKRSYASGDYQAAITLRADVADFKVIAVAGI